MSIFKYLTEAEDVSMVDAVVQFLKDNPNPSDEQVHDWAEENEYDIHEIEAEIYKLATAHVQEPEEGGEEIEEALEEKDNYSKMTIKEYIKNNGVWLEFPNTPDGAKMANQLLVNIDVPDEYLEPSTDDEDWGWIENFTTIRPIKNADNESVMLVAIPIEFLNI